MLILQKELCLFSTLKNVDIEDLLGRDTVPPDQNLLQLNIRNKIVLVTGAGGLNWGGAVPANSGSSATNSSSFDQNEYSLYAIHDELVDSANAHSIKLIPLIGSVLDEARIDKFFRFWSPDTIFHAAAYKHVPLVEQNLLEGSKQIF